MDSIIVPIAICVVLPVSIVFLATWREYNKDNKRAEILRKAIESNKEIDANKLAESLGSPNNQNQKKRHTQQSAFCGSNVLVYRTCSWLSARS